jgi:hypothetical protein
LLASPLPLALGLMKRFTLPSESQVRSARVAGTVGSSPRRWMGMMGNSCWMAQLSTAERNTAEGGREGGGGEGQGTGRTSGKTAGGACACEFSSPISHPSKHPLPLPPLLADIWVAPTQFKTSSPGPQSPPLHPPLMLT